MTAATLSTRPSDGGHGIAAAGDDADESAVLFWLSRVAVLWLLLGVLFSQMPLIGLSGGAVAIAITAIGLGRVRSGWFLVVLANVTLWLGYGVLAC